MLNEIYHIPFIYITSHYSSNIIQQAKHTYPIAYLTKPFKKQDLLIALQLGFYKEELKKSFLNQECLIINEGHTTSRIPFEDIIWLKAEKNYTSIHSASGKITIVRKVITETLGLLALGNFAKIHKSYAVNVNYVTKVKGNKIYLDEIELPVGRTYFSSLQKSLKNQ